MDKAKIITHFGEAFYTKVLHDLETYAKRWSLSGFSQIDYYSVNCLFKCVSEKHGLCILKIGKPSIETKTEFQILKEYEDGGKFCRVYEVDIENGILLIERIEPGFQLRAEPSLEKRLDLFCQLFCGLHKEPTDKTIYPTYRGWVSRITEFMSHRAEHQLLYEKMAGAELICRSLCEKYPGEKLLHGDFHHDNILLDVKNKYRIIDPKGVIGDPVFDIPRFILNEFEDKCDEAFIKKYTCITKYLSEKLDIPEFDIRCLVYVETCMANCWNVESSVKPDMESVLFTEQMMEKI